MEETIVSILPAQFPTTVQLGSGIVGLLVVVLASQVYSARRRNVCPTHIFAPACKSYLITLIYSPIGECAHDWQVLVAWVPHPRLRCSQLERVQIRPDRGILQSKFFCSLQKSLYAR